MCFDVKSKRAKIAKENIKCYKYLFPEFYGNKYECAVKEFHYIPNKLNKRIKIKKNGSRIDEGYHSYRKRETSESCKDAGRHQTYLFIIPKGTRYFENEEQYVSETIMLVE